MDHWTVYLAGEIHSSWRDDVIAAARRLDVPARFVSPELDHDASDRCGVEILGPEDRSFWADRKGAGLNAVRTQSLLRRADIVVACFGEKYRQWNGAFDAGQAVAASLPLITLHPESLDHALKEVDAAACAVARTPEQVAKALAYALGKGGEAG